MTLPFTPINICAERGCGRQRVPYQSKCAEHAAADRKQWSWWAGEAHECPRAGDPDTYDWVQPECYSINETTREAAIAAARREFGPEAHIALVEATQDGPFETDVFDDGGHLVDKVIETFAEQNAERFGEDGFEGDINHTHLATHLNAAFSAFIAAHARDIKVWSFTEKRHAEIVAPESVA